MYEIWFSNLGIKIEHLSEVMISIFGFKIYWYGFFISIAFMLGILTMLKEVKRTGQDKDIYIDFATYALIGSIIGARLYYVAFSFDQYRGDLLSIFNIRGGGLAIYGGVLAAVIIAIVYCKIKKIEFFRLADTIVPSLILGQAIGRWGNFVNKEAFGGYTDSIFAMRILVDKAKYIPQSLVKTIVEVDGFKYLQVHPTFLYESVWNAAVFTFLVIYRKKFKRFNGEVLSLYFILYGIGRFFIEGMRTDQLLIKNTGIPVSQVVSVVLILVGCTIIIIKKRRSKVIK